MNHYASLVEYLKKPDSYPHEPEDVEHIQTHISHVFIASPFVYKLKKPLNLEFLDFSSLEKRHFYCIKEIELNRRLCKETYLGVVPIYTDNGSFELGTIRGTLQKDRNIGPSAQSGPEAHSATGKNAEQDSAVSGTKSGTDEKSGFGAKNRKPVEYAVKMRQLEKKNFLIEIIRSGNLQVHHLEKVADRLENFYKQLHPEDELQKYGRPQSIRYNSDENFLQTRSYVDKTIGGASYKAIQLFMNGFLEIKKSLFEKRVKEKRIVDGHGDLHLEHIYIAGNRVCIYDCIEFNQRFRILDVAADLAFLAMDLDFNHLEKESRDFIFIMSDKLDDPDLLHMTDFYKCYRAFIRGKVKSIESEGEEVSAAGRKKAAETAARYFSLALRYSLSGSEPIALIVFGRIASGKSTLASSLSEKTGLRCYSTDRIRKEIAGISPTTYLPDDKRRKLYQKKVSAKTYSRLLRNGLLEIQNGRSVILDGTFSRKEIREEWIRYFEDQNIDYLFIEAVAGKDIRRERLQNRNQRTDIISDARLSEMEMLDEQYAPTGHIKSACKIRIDTALPLNENREKLFRLLTEHHLGALQTGD